MRLGDPAEAVRAKAELAQRHARELREEALAQRARTREARGAELASVAKAREQRTVDADVLGCDRCHAQWRGEVIREAMRRNPSA